MSEDAPWRPRTGQKIERLYAWIAEEPDGGEGVIAGLIPGLPGWSPLVGADRARIESFRGSAESLRVETGYPVRLKMFAAGVVIDELG